MIETLTYVTAFFSISAVAISAYRLGRVPHLSKLNSDAADRALSELQLQRDELSKLRFDYTRDRDELREHVAKHERAIVRMGEDVRGAIEEVRKEGTKLALLQHGQPQRRL